MKIIILIDPLPQLGFSGPMKLHDETNDANEHNVIKNPNCQKTDQLPRETHKAEFVHDCFCLKDQHRK